jgi:hypothetical protein
MMSTTIKANAEAGPITLRFYTLYMKFYPILMSPNAASGMLYQTCKNAVRGLDLRVEPSIESQVPI